MGGAEPQVNFFLESTREIAVRGRAVVNGWYATFPDSDGTFLRRLRSTKDPDHLTALDELFVHDRLTKVARVRYEENGEGPDFRLYRDSEYVGAVEVLSLFMRQPWSDELGRHDRIADELNRLVPAERWFLQFQIRRLDREPSVRRLAEWVRRTVAALPPSDPDAPEPITPLEAVYRTADVEIEFQFIPRRGPIPSTDRIVGMGPTIGGVVDSASRLRTALNAKAGRRYDLRDAPFAIFVMAHDTFLDLYDIVAALYGSERVSVPSGEVSRGGDGFFGRSNASVVGKNTRVSCVFVAKRWKPWAPEEQPILRLDNPFAARAFPDDLPSIDSRFREVERDERGFRMGWIPSEPEG